MPPKRPPEEKTPKPITCSRCPTKTFKTENERRSHQYTCIKEITCTFLDDTKVKVQRDPHTKAFVCPGEGCTTTSPMRGEKSGKTRWKQYHTKEKKKTKCTDNTTSKQVLFLSLWFLLPIQIVKERFSSVTGASVCSDLIDSMCCGVPCVFLSLVSSCNPTCQQWCSSDCAEI